jgi:hypothetical protein
MKKAAIFLSLMIGLSAAASAPLQAQGWNVPIPAGLSGTWFRAGASSGRAFDTWLTISSGAQGATLQWRYSDGRPNEIAFIFYIEPVSASDPDIDTFPGKAAQFPSGWIVDAVENGEEVWYAFLVNPAGNRLTHSSTDMQDIWVRQ